MKPVSNCLNHRLQWTRKSTRAGIYNRRSVSAQASLSFSRPPSPPKLFRSALLAFPTCLPHPSPKRHFPFLPEHRANLFISCTLSLCPSCDRKCSSMAYSHYTPAEAGRDAAMAWLSVLSLHIAGSSYMRQLGDFMHSTLPGMLLARLRRRSCASINLCGFHGRVTKFSLRVPLHSSERIRVPQCPNFRILIVRLSQIQKDRGGSAVTKRHPAMAPPAVSSTEAHAAPTMTPVKVYSKDSEQLVKKSWEILKKDAQRNGINFFRKVFEIAPGAKSMYSFLRDSTIPFEENPKVKNHARSVFIMTGDAAVQLGEKGVYQVLDSRLQKLAATHVNAGVTDDQFEIVKVAILYAIEMGVPELWSAELKAAWGDAYDMLAEAVKAEMRAQRAVAAHKSI